MKVTKKVITPDAELTIVEIARVSSSRKNKKDQPEVLLRYLIKHKHWSPFEHAYLTLEIETSKAIGIQLLRHRSFTFQEFSQRYSVVDGFEEVELRQQADNNRQSSTEVFDPEVELYSGFGGSLDSDCTIASEAISDYLYDARLLYKELLSKGVARECARMVLPMCTKTTIFMTGSIRSWIHFLEIRDDPHAQKEIQLIAKEIKKIFIQELPIISKTLNYG